MNVNGKWQSQRGREAIERGEKPLNQWNTEDLFYLTFQLRDLYVRKKMQEVNFSTYWRYSDITLESLKQWLERCGYVGYHHSCSDNGVYYSIAYYSVDRAIEESLKSLALFNILIKKKNHKSSYQAVNLKTISAWCLEDVYYLSYLLEQNKVKDLVKGFKYSGITVKNMKDWLKQFGRIDDYRNGKAKRNTLFNLNKAIKKSLINPQRFKQLIKKSEENYHAKF